MFKEAHNRGVIDLRILENGVGCEKFSKVSPKYLQDVVQRETDGSFCI